MPDTSRPRWFLPVVLGGLLLAGILALTQPWLLWIDAVADEQLPTVAAAPSTDTEATADPTAAPTAGPTPSASASTAPQPAPSPTATGPVTLATGSFISRDHATTGEVAIVQLEDGSRVLTIQDLQTDNGPDLYVYLDDSPADGDEDAFDDGIDLGRLRGNVGDLVYEIPDTVDLDQIVSVGIWCDRFSSLFGAADLAPA